MKLEERIKYARKMNHDFIAEKDGSYTSGKWAEIKYAEKCGWTFIGTVAELSR